MINLRKLFAYLLVYKFKLLGVIVVIFLGYLFYLALYPNLAPEWTGFGKYTMVEREFRAKKFWDWLQLFIIPIALSLGAWFLNKWQKETETEIENERQRQNAMESYFDFMTELILEKKLLKEPSDETQAIARTKTMAMFRFLDGGRKAQILQFVYEVGLIRKEKPILNLNGFDLTKINLNGAKLERANLMCVHFNGANLSNTYIIDCDFSASDLSNVDFRGADLSKSSFFLQT